ncbi:metallophosphatase family protein [Dehalococcoidia bacterium]|nr:metallophosphatase family protein [Dehalococcoidia bacterium]
MKIAVISDTHVESLGSIPTPILMKLEEVDLIVHAGDFTKGAVLEELRMLGEVKAVCGNMDSSELQRMLPSKELFTVNGKRIGLIHGSGGPWGIAKRIRPVFDDVDIIIYGHSHEPHSKVIQGSLLFNPGPARNYYGLLTIEDEVKAEIVRI